MQCAQCMILFLLLVVNSAWFRILCSYTLLLKLPFLYALVAQHASLKVYRVGKILVNKFALSKRSYGHLISVNIYYYHASFAIQIYISFNKKNGDRVSTTNRVSGSGVVLPHYSKNLSTTQNCFMVLLTAVMGK